MTVPANKNKDKIALFSLHDVRSINAMAQHKNDEKMCNIISNFRSRKYHYRHGRHYQFE